MYKYNRTNLLNNSENYMYSEFEGEIFFKHFFDNRNIFINKIKNYTFNSNSKIASRCLASILNRLNDKSSKMHNVALLTYGQVFNLEAQLKHDPKENKIHSEIHTFSKKEKIESLKLLNVLLMSVLVCPEEKKNKYWIDSFLQRFEVTKKIFQIYNPGFRKGVNAFNDLELYSTFALILCSYYSYTFEIKYLNTLLKLCDLISSLPKKDLITANVSKDSFLFIMLSEILFVNLLLKKKELD